MQYPKWTDTPSCSSTDTEMWFPQDDKPTAYPDIKLLQRICSECPVRQQCFDYALRVSVEGYWAGTTPKVREQMRVRLGIRSTPIYNGLGELRGA